MIINSTDSFKHLVKSQEVIDNVEKAAVIAHKALNLAQRLSLSGTRASYVDKQIEDFIISENAYPANLEVEGFGHSVCISKSSEIVHGLPSSKKILVSGDLVCMDVGVKYNGCYADVARSFLVETTTGASVNDKALAKMNSVCKVSLEMAIGILKPGMLLSEYGRTVDTLVKEFGFTTMKFLTGHAIGKKYHEAPHIYNFYHPNNDIELKENMVFAFELMITNGSDRYKKDDDGWTLHTADGSLAVHFEHTVLIEKTGSRILGIKKPMATKYEIGY